MARFAPTAAPKRLRRSALVIAALVLGAFGTMAIRATITVDTARAEVEESLSALAGVRLPLGGGATARLLPWPSVRFDDVFLERRDDGRVVATMASLDVSLDVAALLLGRLRPEELRLSHPDVRLTLDDARPSLGAIVAAVAEWKPISVTVEKGRFALATAAGEEVLDTVDARLSWPRPSANLQLRAGFRWRGESIGFDLDSPSPVRLLAGETGASSLRLTSAPLRLAFSGTAGLISPVRFDGTGDVEIVDAARFARWSGLPRTHDLLAGRFRLDGRLTTDARGATMPDARLDVAGNKAEGALTLRWDAARPRLSGTIAFAALDFTSGRRRPFGAGWPDLPFDRDARSHDLDLRLSTPNVKLPGATLSRVAAALHVSEGRLRAEIGNAEIFGKPVTATVRGTLGGNGLEAQIRAGGEELPLADIAKLFAVPGVEAGRTSANFDGESRCSTLGACLAATTGHVRLDARATKVTGASPFADMSRFRPIVPQANGTTVTTAWDAVAVDMRLAGARATVDRVEILGQDARFLFAGKGDLVSGAVDLTGHAYFPAFRPDPARNGTNEVAVPLRIGGTLRRLEITSPDAAPPPEAAPQPQTPAAP